MVARMGPEATAALVGAGVGVLGGGVLQVMVAALARRRTRREAASLIHWELASNYGSASAAATYGVWPTSAGAPRRAAWDAFAASILSGKGRRRRAAVSMIAMAYNALDNVEYGASAAGGPPTYTGVDEDLHLILAGAYQAGRLAGFSQRELQARQLYDADVARVIEDAETRMRRSRSRRAKNGA